MVRGVVLARERSPRIGKLTHLNSLHGSGDFVAGTFDQRVALRELPRVEPLDVIAGVMTGATNGLSVTRRALFSYLASTASCPPGTARAMKGLLGSVAASKSRICSGQAMGLVRGSNVRHGRRVKEREAAFDTFSR